jgi:hypothetical protein
MLKWFFVAVVLYGGFVALLYVLQRSLQYFPERQRTTSSAVGLSEAKEEVLDTSDSERVNVAEPTRVKKDRKGRPGAARALAKNPDATRDIYAERCACGAALEEAGQELARA